MLSSSEFAAFLESFEVKPKIATTRRQIIFEHWRLIEELIKHRGYSYQELSDRLKTQGFDITPGSLQVYVSQARHSGKRNRKRSTANPAKRSPAASFGVATEPVPALEQSAPGIVATESEQPITVAPVPERSPVAAQPVAAAPPAVPPVPVPVQPAPVSPVAERSPAGSAPIPIQPVTPPLVSAVPPVSESSRGTRFKGNIPPKPADIEQEIWDAIYGTEEEQPSVVEPPKPPERRPTMDELRAKYPNVFPEDNKTTRRAVIKL